MGTFLYTFVGIIQYLLICAMPIIPFYAVNIWLHYKKDAGIIPKIKSCLLWIFVSLIIIGLGFAKTPLINAYNLGNSVFLLSPTTATFVLIGQLNICILLAFFQRSKLPEIEKITREKELEQLQYRKLNKKIFKQYKEENKHVQNSKIILRAVKKNRWKITNDGVSYPSYLAEFEYLGNGKVYVMLPRDQFYEMPWLLSRNYYRVNDKFIFEHIDAFCLDASAARDKWIKKYQENNDIIDKVNDKLAACMDISSWRIKNGNASKKQ